MAALIMWVATTSLIENMNLLVGEGADDETIEEIQGVVMKYGDVAGITDLSIHDYGPDNRIAIIKVKPDNVVNIDNSNATLDCIADELHEKLGLNTTLYWAT
jgi:divalent metal cation (Fe/Co/Zn/Cd) transporter